METLMPTKPKSGKPAWDKLTLQDVEQWGQVFAEPESVAESSDRFTFVFPDGSYLGMNAVPFHPQFGVAQHGEGIVEEWRNEHEKHRVKSQRQWRKLPPDVRKCIHGEIEKLKESIVEAETQNAKHYGDGDSLRIEGPVDPVHDSNNSDDRGATSAWVRAWVRVELY